jgi:hypothetical protein
MDTRGAATYGQSADMQGHGGAHAHGSAHGATQVATHEDWQYGGERPYAGDAAGGHYGKPTDGTMLNGYYGPPHDPHGPSPYHQGPGGGPPGMHHPPQGNGPPPS